MNSPLKVQKHAEAVSRRFSRNWHDKEDNLQECRIKLWELEQKGIDNPLVIMKSLSNRLRDLSRGRGRYESLKQRSAKISDAVHVEHLWDRNKIAEALTVLPKLQAEILSNMIEPSKPYRDKLVERYKGKSHIKSDQNALAEVLGISASKLSRQKEDMLIAVLSYFRSCQ